MRKAVRVIFIVVIAAALVSSVRYCASPYAAETVTYYEYEKSVSGSGYILRPETLVRSEAPGVFEPYVNDGERVAKNAKVGAVITGRPDDAMVDELNTINERIEDIEKSRIMSEMYRSDAVRIAGAVSADVKSLREAVREGDYARASELKREVGYLKERGAEIETDSGDELLAELYERKADIETAIGGAQSEVFAPLAGIYSASVDGLERYGDEDVMAELTPSQVEGFGDLLSDAEKDENVLCKITDNYNWYLAAVISAEEAEDVTVGADVSLMVDASETAEVDASVLSLSKEEDGKRVVIVRCNKFVDGITGMRGVDYKLILQRKSGLRIPSEALRIEDGEKGVYILIDKHTKQFKSVNNDPFGTEDDKYYIVDRNYTPPGAKASYVPLKELDKVLLKPEDVK